MDLIEKFNKSLNVNSSTESCSADTSKTTSDDNIKNTSDKNQSPSQPGHEDKYDKKVINANADLHQEASNPSCDNSDSSSSPSAGDFTSNETLQCQKPSPNDLVSQPVVIKSASPPTPTSQQSGTFLSNLMRGKRKKKKEANTSNSATNLSDVITQVDRPDRNRVTYFHNSSWRSIFCCGCQWKRRQHQRSLYEQTVLMSGITGKKLNCFVPHNGIYQSGGPVLLQAIKEEDKSRKCLIIDLDETLVHSSFKAVENADFKVGVDIEGTVHQVFVLKRPYVDQFLKQMADIYECVLFTASLAKYADPVADFLDQWGVFRHRLFRDACVYHRGNYVKDLGRLGRPLDQVVILDNSPASYLFHTTHAVQVTSWFDDPNDHALLDLIPYFESLAKAPNVPDFLVEHPPPLSATGVLALNVPMVSTASMSSPHVLSLSACPIASATPMTDLQQRGDISPVNKSSHTTSHSIVEKTNDSDKIVPVNSSSIESSHSDKQEVKS